MKKILAKIKKLHKSLTAWLNATAVSIVPLLVEAKDQLPGLKTMLPVDIYKYAFIGLVVSNLLLRFHTSKPLNEK